MVADLCEFPPPNLPLLARGETLYSWSGHVHRWNGHTHATTTSRQLFGESQAALRHDFPSHVGVLAERTRGLLGEARALALQHTLLGYFLPFIAEATAESLLESVTHGAIPRLKLILGLAASRAGSLHPLRGCGECFRTDELVTGFAPWRLVHQFPSSAVCRTHHRPLLVCLSSTTPIYRQEWLLPRSGRPHKWIELPVHADRHFEMLSKVALFAENVAELLPGALDSKILGLSYKIALEDRGFLSGGHTSRPGSLAKLIRSYYSGLEQVPGFAILKANGSDWLRLVGPRNCKYSCTGHPLKHLLLMGILFDSWEDATISYVDAARQSPVRPSIPTIHLRPHGNLPDDASLESVRELLKSGKSKGQIIEQTGISYVSLNEVIRSEPRLSEAWRTGRMDATTMLYRAKFLDVLAKNPGVPIALIKKIPANSHQWLYRYDREWLNENMPALWKPSN